ncbi:MAG: integrin alpha [Planctomycetes bacterium]|nr:integrin alpha [Planctomycetota bacterium]
MLQDAFRKRRCALLLPALLVAAAPPLAAQEYPVWSAPGPVPSGQIGGNLARVGDVDGDGVDDLAVAGSGSARVLSGDDGSLLFPLAPLPLILGALSPSIAGIGDIDGDGLSEIAVGAGSPLPSGGAVSAHSGATGAPLWTALGATFENIGRSVAGPGDMNGDGIPDVATGGLNRVRWLSGANGATVLTVQGGVTGQFGRSLAAAGDLDGDGVGDLFAGSPGQAFITPAGPVVALSGANGSTLRTYPPGGIPAFDYGFAVAAAGDLDGDSTTDLLVGSPQVAVLLPPISIGNGLLHAFSGATGTVLFSASGGGFDDNLGASVAGIGDVSGDGIPDVAVGAPQQAGFLTVGSGYVRVLSGASGLEVMSAGGAVFGDRFGAAVAGAGDASGDGVPDLAVGAPAADPAGVASAGEVRAISFVGIPPTGTVLGSGCPGTGGLVPRISISGGTPDSAGNPGIRIHLTSARPSAPALWIIGFSSTIWLGIPLPADLAVLSMPGCFLRVSADVLVPTLTSAAGRASFPHPTPPDPALSGLTVFNQWFVVDPGPAVFPGVTTAGLALGIL